MQQQVSVVPVGALVEEVVFNLGALASREGVTIDGKDWYGSTQAQFTDDRKAAWPFLDVAIRPPGNVNVNVQFATTPIPAAEPPVLTFTIERTVGVAGGTWGGVVIRVPTRFWRVQVVDTSNAANDGIYMAYFVRGN